MTYTSYIHSHYPRTVPVRCYIAAKIRITYIRPAISFQSLNHDPHETHTRSSEVPQHLHLNDIVLLDPQRKANSVERTVLVRTGELIYQSRGVNEISAFSELAAT